MGVSPGQRRRVPGRRTRMRVCGARCGNTEREVSAESAVGRTRRPCVRGLAGDRRTAPGPAARRRGARAGASGGASPACARSGPGCVTGPGGRPGRRQRLAVAARRAEGDRVGLGALEVQVRGVLPGHADAAVQLDALLGGVDGDPGAVRLGDGDRERRRRGCRWRARRRRCGRRRGRTTTSSHSCASRCLSAWNEPTGRLNWWRSRVCRTVSVQAPLGEPELLGGEQPGPGAAARGVRPRRARPASASRVPVRAGRR